MKKALLIALALFTAAYSANAQWYSNKYGVENINDLSNEQLMKSYSDAKASSICGVVATGTGTGLVIFGMGKAMTYSLEYMAVSIMSFGDTAAPPPQGSKGGGLIITGLVMAAGGTALWITGGSRKREIKPILRSRGLISGLSVSPGAGYDLLTDTYYPALTLRIKF
jgi:hypothetical protein